MGFRIRRDLDDAQRAERTRLLDEASRIWADAVGSPDPQKRIVFISKFDVMKAGTPHTRRPEDLMQAIGQSLKSWQSGAVDPQSPIDLETLLELLS